MSSLAKLIERKKKAESLPVEDLVFNEKNLTAYLNISAKIKELEANKDNDELIYITLLAGYLLKELKSNSKYNKLEYLENYCYYAFVEALKTNDFKTLLYKTASLIEFLKKAY